ncbi:hypothetical protein ACP4OV_022621 [Aristida adscensionis]
MDCSMGLREIESRLPPGFRFHPSDQELVCYYLRDKVVANQHSSQLIISSPPPSAATTMVEVDLHAREPWELPEAAKLSDKEWYFFSFRDRKYATGSRRNRATKVGYWKATGKDKPIHGSPGGEMEEEGGMAMVIGMRKTLVFYLGRAPNGRKSGWVMHEFRLNTPASPPKEDWVLCRVFHKGEAEQGCSCNDAITCSSNNVTQHPSLAVLCSPQHAPPPADNHHMQRRQLLLPTSSPAPPPPIIVSDQVEDADRFLHQDAGIPEPAMLLMQPAELAAGGAGRGVVGLIGDLEFLQGVNCQDHDGVLFY